MVKGNFRVQGGTGAIRIGADRIDSAPVAPNGLHPQTASWVPLLPRHDACRAPFPRTELPDVQPRHPRRERRRTGRTVQQIPHRSVRADPVRDGIRRRRPDRSIHQRQEADAGIFAWRDV